MDAAANAERITEWLNQQVDPAFRPLIQKIAGSGTQVRWEKQDVSRTLRVQFGAREIVYTICLQSDSDPVSGQLLFETPESENRKSFAPALEGGPRTSEEMTGSDIVNDLIDQYGRWCKQRGTPVRKRGVQEQ